ncbi:MAG TPA: glycosyltransferase family 2 protein [Acidobacteriaceae bacterium]
MNPIVSAVIPTHKRPILVQRAIRSALNQSYLNLEVIVVVDGPEPDTVKILEAFEEPRLRIVELRQNVGPAEVRNIGVREANGEWIAFLDDDDEWLPAKIEKQLNLLAYADPRTNFIACRSQEVDSGIDKIIPRRFPRPGEDWSEYIFCSGGFLPVPGYLIKRELMLSVPFLNAAASFEDVDWLLRARAANSLVPAWVDEALVIYHNGSGDTIRVSHDPEWDRFYKWARSNRGILLTPKAFSYCLLTQGSQRIKRSKGFTQNFASLMYRAISEGEIDFRFCLSLFFFAFLDVRSRSILRLIYERTRREVRAMAGIKR